MKGDIMLVSFDHCDLTLGEVMEVMREFQETHPGWEVFVGGDEYGVVARPPKGMAEGLYRERLSASLRGMLGRSRR